MLNPSQVKSVAIHPGIGIARVGNATGEDDYFFGPEVPGAGPDAPGGFRDACGHLKRQAARFRIYATLQDDKVVEITAEDARIEWRVELANLKAGWYRFTTAMDLPRNLAVSCTRRNPYIGLTDVSDGFLKRAQLDIVPHPKKIEGVKRSGKDFVFGDGKFFDQEVYLGELRTDEAGRLIVLGGRGATGANPPDKTASTFANNDGWHDDISDGPVRATVTIGGQSFEAEPGYVVVTPPNYGPGLFGVLTMDDVAHEAFYAARFLDPPARPSFTKDIWPIFDRLSGNQWVNHGIFMLHGIGSPLDARNLDVVQHLADASAGAQPFRDAVFKLFRDPDAIKNPGPLTLPPFYGDGIDYIDANFTPLDTSADLTLTPTLQGLLRQWSEGDFDSDWTGFPVLPAFDDLPPAEQRGALDRANLYDLLGGPFHPGIELTWIMRRPSLWQAPYRLKIVPEGTRTRQNFGSELTPEICLSETGPLSEVGAGALTRWLGVPWQTDAGSCASGGEYTPQYYLSSPSFWGARVPNQVLPQAALERLKDSTLDPAQRARHFDSRKPWYRLLDKRGGKNSAQAMIGQWPLLGIVQPFDAPEGMDVEGPLHVEVAPKDKPVDDPTLALMTSVEHLRGQQRARAQGLEASPAPPPPSSRTFKPPRIHYGRGDV
jgi:hypothetical protein